MLMTPPIVPPLAYASTDPQPWWRSARTRYRLFRVCGWSRSRALFTVLPGSTWLLRGLAFLLGSWLA